MATIAKAMHDLARTLLENPGLYEVAFWRRGNDWLWTLRGEPSPPTGYEAMASDRIDNSDQKASSSPEDTHGYALELLDWAKTFDKT
jgi:hypothetical protein